MEEHTFSAGTGSGEDTYYGYRSRAVSDLQRQRPCEDVFSVGQHCINCALEAEARGYSPRLVLACLLHDASEAYLSDVPRPFKKSMPQYRELEQRLLDVIYCKYLGSALSEEEEHLLKVIDNDLLWYDLKELLNEWDGSPEPELKTAVSYEAVPFRQVEKTYLEMYERLKSALCAAELRGI